MARPPAPPLVYVHADALTHEPVRQPVAPQLARSFGVSVDDWVEALHVAEIEVMAEEQELGEVPEDPTFADTEAVVVDASTQVVDDVYAS